MSNPRKGRAHKPLNPELKEQLINAYVNEFLTIEQTALRFNLSQWKVFNTLRAEGLTRPTGPRKGHAQACGRKPGFTMSEEHKRKIGLAHLGKRHSDESKKKMSERKVGVPRSDEFKEHISEVLTGRPRDPDIGKRISEDHKHRREDLTE